MIQGALWDPDAGLVKPRSQMVAGELVDAAVASGKLRSFANTACTGLRIENGRIRAWKPPAGSSPRSTSWCVPDCGAA
jgi:glycine/D-amino acid oxidase-like deaminating enzyme